MLDAPKKGLDMGKKPHIPSSTESMSFNPEGVLDSPAQCLLQAPKMSVTLYPLFFPQMCYFSCISVFVELPSCLPTIQPFRNACSLTSTSGHFISPCLWSWCSFCLEDSFIPLPSYLRMPIHLSSLISSSNPLWNLSWLASSPLNHPILYLWLHYVPTHCDL